ncbi:MAG: Lon protease family protein [Candidatus Methylumidiphilus sp.]
MVASEHPTPLPAEQLAACFDPAALPFADTSEAGFAPFFGVAGQQGAQEAIAFGVAMARPGFNVFVSGMPGTGRLSLAWHYLEAVAKRQETPDDWLYLNQFGNLREPLALALPAGLGKAFQTDMERLVDSLFATFSAAFEHPGYQRGKVGIERAFAQRFSRAIDEVERRAQSEGVALFRDGETVSFAPLSDGKAVSEEAFAAFTEAEKGAFQEKALGLEDFLADRLAELPQWRRETSERLRQLNRATLDQAVGPLLAPLAQKYAGQPAVLAYLEALRGDLPGNLEAGQEADAADEAGKRRRLLERYAPKLLVSHQPGAGAPVVVEANPTYQNLFGRIEFTNEQGVLTTHLRLICPGALHQANGGYLLLEADKMAGEPQVWPALKRALQSRLLRIEPPSPDPATPVAMGLSPQPLPLELKLVLVGGRDLYYLLQEMDDEFNELFRVLADFDDHLSRDTASIAQVAGLLKAYVERSGFAPLSAAAVARLLEFSGRLAEDQRRLSARIGDLFELAAEAERLRGEAGGAVIEAAHVAAALAGRERRLGRISRELLEQMLDGTILIGTAGEAVGRVNGLTVLEVGGSRFGMPARISATVSPGGRGVVDIEREAELGQAIHSKGVLILSGFLAQKYAKDFPLRLSATIALEQSYGYVDGDSASLAELLALLSALTGVALRQSLAVTGSVNQYGEVQAVGGVNEKIEGFFRLCQARGFGGGQGVVIPSANVANLMLDGAVVEAARRGDFAVYAVDSVDQALGLLTGKPASAVNRLAVSRLRAMARWAGKD